MTICYSREERDSNPLMLVRPYAGLSGEDVEGGVRMLASVPTYGTQDAGRGLWRRIRKVLMRHGFRGNLAMNDLYSYERDRVVEAILATHVNDLLWADSGSAEEVLMKVERELVFGTEDESNLRFCGTEFS